MNNRRFLSNTLLTALLLLLFTLIIYISLAGRLTGKFWVDPGNYFSYQAESFLMGRLDLVNPQWDHDLSVFQNKLYMYWGPSPELLILPVIFIWGVQVSDALYTAIFGALTPVIIYLCLVQLDQLGITKLTNFKKILLSLFFAFGTVYFSVAVRGGVWFTSQTISTLYICLSCFWLFRFLKNPNRTLLILSAFSFGFSAWARNTFAFYFPFMIVLLFLRFRKQSTILYINFILYGVVLLALLVVIGLYNYARFGSALETGYQYHHYAEKFKSDSQKYGFLNPAFIPHNFYYTFLNPPKLKTIYPYFEFDGEGNSFILLSPFFLFIFFLLHKTYWKKNRWFLLAAFLSVITIVLFQLNFFGTGWFQFSARYLLDIIPLLIFILAIVISKVKTSYFLLFIVLSIFLNSLGALWLTGIIK